MATWGKGQARKNFLGLLLHLCKKLPGGSGAGAESGPAVTNLSISGEEKATCFLFTAKGCFYHREADWKQGASWSLGVQWNYTDSLKWTFEKSHLFVQHVAFGSL